MATSGTEDIARAFLACRLPPAAEEDLVSRLAGVRREARARSLRWIRREHWHLTVRFFGPLPGERRAAVETAIAGVAASTPAFRARLSVPRALPSWRAPHLVALEIASDGALVALAARVELATAGVVGGPDKPFLAHLSVVRLRRPTVSDLERIRAAFAGVDVAGSPAFEVSSIVLYRSDLEREGPRYSELARFALAAAAQATPS